MEVAGLCSVCQRPGALTTCPLCGATAHARCLDAPAHAHGSPPKAGRRPDWGEPRT